MRVRVAAGAIALAGLGAALLIWGRARNGDALLPSRRADGTAHVSSSSSQAVERASAASRSSLDAPGAARRGREVDGIPGRTSRGGADDDGGTASDMLAAVRDAIAQGTSASNATLLRALDGDDEVAKIEAIDALVARKHAPALRKLVAFDPGADPFVAPTAILALGKLARDAEAEARASAVARLAKILEEEKERKGTDSPGNILTAIEALGEVRTPSAARVLERELVAPEHRTAVRVAIVDALEVCAEPSSVTSLVAFRSAFRPGATDAFEREVENDLVAALERAIASLSQRR